MRAGTASAVIVALGAALAVTGAAVGGRLRRSRVATGPGREASRRPDPDGDVRLSVVLPAYDEESTIGDTVRRIRDELGGVLGPGGLELVVVDDGSGDRTLDAARDGGADVVIRHETNRGKGAAVRTGVLAANGRTVVFTDADLAYGPDHLIDVLGTVEGGWDVVVGSRSHPASAALVAPSALRTLGSRAINLLSRTVLRRGYGDTQSGLKGFRRDVARLVFGRTTIDGMGFDIEVLFLVERFGLSLEEIPVRVANSRDSSVHVFRDGLRLVRDVLRVRRRAAEGAYGPVDGGSVELPAPRAV